MPTYVSRDPTAGTAVSLNAPRPTDPTAGGTPPAPTPSVQVTPTAGSPSPTAGWWSPNIVGQLGYYDPIAKTWVLASQASDALKRSAAPQIIPPVPPTYGPRTDTPASRDPRGDPNAPVPPTPTSPGGTTTSTSAPKITNPTDPAQITAWLQWLATQPNADPILKTPGGIQYYLQRILETGGLTDTGYWQTKASIGPNGVGGADGGSLINTLPSAADAANMPGIQFALDKGMQQIQRSAIGQGDLLTSGTLRDLADYSTQAALAYGYVPLANLRLAYNQANVGNLNTLAQAGSSAANSASS